MYVGMLAYRAPAAVILCGRKAASRSPSFESLRKAVTTAGALARKLGQP